MRLQVLCENRMGIAHEILDVLVQYKIDLTGIETGPDGQIYLHIPNLEFDKFQDLMPNIRKVGGVTDVSTIAYMPQERERQELLTLVRTLPEPIISIDARGHIIVANYAAKRIFKLSDDEIKDRPLKQWIKGFNINKWLNQNTWEPQTTYIQLKNHTYLCDIMPINLPEASDEEPVMAGAVLTFKSPSRLGKQMIAFNQTAGEFDMIISESPLMKKLIRQAKKMSQLDAPILISGATGTGKNLLAKACHQHSLRRDKPFLTLNCGSLPKEAAESELFGQTEGAFEGARESKGIFEQAEGGTVFLDEIGELDLSLQTKFLGLLQNGRFRKVGAEQEVRVDVRIICSSQQNLVKKCQQGTFRQDLYYRLDVLSLELPALRDRPLDILPLAEHFIARFSEPQKKYFTLSKPCQNLLTQYQWPGNVRQLENTLFKAVTLLEGEVMEPEDIQLPENDVSFSSFGYRLDENFSGSLDEAVKKFESEILRRLYPAYPSSRLLGRKLGISHTAIANKLRDYGIRRVPNKSESEEAGC
ncbi:transcriptional regulator TyrR [Gynuella sunshinyii]|nr:transcriptional regulator TyrR [Gynuella sunshinyii]